jgi:predicted ferric reductase/mono/diheme cytochrome c family protein
MGDRLPRLAAVKLAALRGPLVMAVLCGIPLVLWARAAPIGPRFSSSTLALTSTAVLFAFAGTAAFAINLVLGARFRFVESLFGGLDRMYRVHRQNGQIAFALLAMHAFLVFAGRVTISVSSGFDLVTPRAGRTVFAGFVALTVMGIALVLTLFVRLGQEVFVYVQRTFGFVFLLATYHVFTTHGAKDLSPALKWYMAALATAGIAAFAYRSLFHNVLVRRKRYTVAAANRLDDFVTEIVLEPRAKPLSYRPGQFVFVSFRSPTLGQRAVDISLQRQVFSIRAGEIGNQFHPFSITSAPGEPTLRITVKAIGDYTSALRRLDEGAEAIVEGPFGSFSNVGLVQPRQIWAAGGIGVTPFLSMARGLADGAGPPVHFYYCVERPEEAHFLDEFRTLAERRDDFEITVVSRDPDGFLSADRLAAENTELASSDVLICGPPAMITNLRAQLVALGLPERQIHAEEFGFAKRGPEAAPPVELAEPREPLQLGASPLPAVLFALAFAVFAFAGGVLVGQSRSSGGPAAPEVAVDVSPASVAAGKAVYASAGCGACHVLAAAGSKGKIGPNLDDAKPDAARVVAVVTNGKGVMPPYRDRLTAKQIEHVAAFVSTASGS